MKCGSCGSENIRLSKRRPRFAIFYEWQGYERYRCRQCRRAFWQVPEATLKEKARLEKSGNWPAFFERRRRRILIELTLFLAMLVIFLATIRYLVNRSDAGGARPMGRLTAPLEGPASTPFRAPLPAQPPRPV